MNYWISVGNDRQTLPVHFDYQLTLDCYGKQFLYNYIIFIQKVRNRMLLYPYSTIYQLSDDINFI